MARKPNTDRNGNSFSEQTKLAVWNKAQIVPGTNLRKDTCGAWIDWSLHGNTTENGSGWEIDHIKPVAKGGGDELSDLQPLQWQNNRKKGDDYPAYGYL
jgi:5-methylcytosine-specific restriction endonuclease McrA